MTHAYLIWPGFTTYNTLIISVNKHDFAIKTEPIEYSGKVFIPKQEAHITVLGSELGTRLLQQFVNKPDIEQQVIQAFESTDWSYTKMRDWRNIARHITDFNGNITTEESIIMLVEMEGMVAFYSKLKTLGLINNDDPVPPPHVTLYTRNCDPGIGIHSESELAELTCERLNQLV